MFLHPLKKIKNSRNLWFLFFVLIASCTSTRNIPYFKNVPDTIQHSTFNTRISNFSEPRIKQGDVLLIAIQTLDPQANAVVATYNPTYSNTPLSINNPTLTGFLVDKDGFVELPLVGRLKVMNLTTSEAKEEIRKKAAVYYKDPVVNVRYGNFTITVLGEVTRPGTYSVANERITILDAIGMAGDLTIFGKRGNVLLVREEEGTRKMTRFDLKDSEIFTSPYFYLRQGDVVYVEPNKAKVANNDQAQIRNISIISAALSFLVVVISRVNL